MNPGSQTPEPVLSAAVLHCHMFVIYNLLGTELSAMGPEGVESGVNKDNTGWSIPQNELSIVQGVVKCVSVINT